MKPSSKEPYVEPLVVKHDPLRDITGAKYQEKDSKEFKCEGKCEEKISKEL